MMVGVSENAFDPPPGLPSTAVSPAPARACPPKLQRVGQERVSCPSQWGGLVTPQGRLWEPGPPGDSCRSIRLFASPSPNHHPSLRVGQERVSCPSQWGGLVTCPRPAGATVGAGR